ncbi:hypothetical protein EDC04DRAFT_1197842 [Pisolithus marmoratus]|nr:hypothetical protein EDC04DRAFT_1197842 [Pisolithus marmoratus]
MVELLACTYLVMSFSFLPARWLWRYEGFCVWMGYLVTWRISRDWAGVLYHYPRFRIDCLSGCCAVASSSHLSCWPTHCLHRISLSSLPRLSRFRGMILLD